MYRPPIDLNQYKGSIKTRTSCPSCGAAITPEQDTQIREQEQKRNESIKEKIEVAGMSPEEREQYFIDNPRANSRAIQKFLEQQQGQSGQPGQQKSFPTGDLWDRKREDNTTGEYLGYVDGKLQTFPNEQAANDAGASKIQPNYTYQPTNVGEVKWEGPGNSRWEEQQKFKSLPTTDLFQRQKQDTGFYQGPSAAEQKKGAIWGAPKKSMFSQDRKAFSFGNLYDRNKRDGNSMNMKMY